MSTIKEGNLYRIDDVNITVTKMDVDEIDPPITVEEIQAYIDLSRKPRPNQKLLSLQLDIYSDGTVGIHSDYNPVKFERIRRITGYLVGTLDRFNDAKLAEVNDRVKHGIGTSAYGNI